MLRLDKHENTDPIYNALVARWCKDLSRDETVSIDVLRHQLAAMLYVLPRNLFFAEDVIGAIYQAYIQPNDKVLCSMSHTKKQYHYLQQFSAKAISLDYQPRYQGPWFDTNQLIELILKEKPKLVCFSNVDSVTGVAIKPAVIRQILDVAHEVDALVFIEEAYYPFYDQTVLPWIDEYHHLLVEQSFANLWGLKQAKFNYVAAHADIIAKLTIANTHLTLDNLSIALVEKALAYQTEMQASVARLLAGKQYFLHTMQQFGFSTIDKTQGNFLHVNFGAQTEAIYRALSRRLMYHRESSHLALSGFSEFTVTTKEVFLPLIQIISQVASKKVVVDGI